MVKLPLLALALWAGVLHAGREDRTLWANGWQRCWPKAEGRDEGLERFPSYALCSGQIDFLVARRTWLKGQRELFPAAMYVPWFDAALEDVEVRLRAWQMLYQVHWWLRSDKELAAVNQVWNDYSTPTRRQRMAHDYLKDLHTLLGERDYNAGVMPGLIGADFMGGR